VPLRRFLEPLADVLGNIRVLQQIPPLIHGDGKRQAPFEIPVLDEMLLGRLGLSGRDGLRDVGVPLEIPVLVYVDAGEQQPKRAQQVYNPVTVASPRGDWLTVRNLMTASNGAT